MQKKSYVACWRVTVFVIVLAAFTGLAQSQTATFSNPVVRSQDAPDPCLVYHQGYYYFTATLDPSGGIWLWKSRTLAGLDSGTKVKVHTPDVVSRSKQIWAPEIHQLDGKWYIYYTASDGVDENHRLYVLESAGTDPLGPYTFKARVYDSANDGWALDPSVFRASDNRLYLLWVAHVPGNGNGIRIAPMSNPWTLSGASTVIAQANYAWERVRYPINEGPVVLQRGGKTFLIYSASDTGTPDYCLGMLTLAGNDVMNPQAWTKSPTPVFSRYSGANGNVFGPGHNSFFKSPDGAEDWLIYHGKETSAYTYNGRTSRAQKFRWNADGTPNFGTPIPASVVQPVPSGENTMPTLVPSPTSTPTPIPTPSPTPSPTPTPTPIPSPVLPTVENSTRLAALDSVTWMREPFSVTTTNNFSLDRRTRLMLFATNVELLPGEIQTALMVQAEDTEGRVFSLPIEYVGVVANFNWLTQINVKLSDELVSVGEVRVSIRLRGEVSNPALVNLAASSSP